MLEREPEPFTEGSRVEREESRDDGLDVPHDDLDKVMNTLGDVDDDDLNDLEDELLSFDYMPFHSFDDAYEEARPCGPLIVEAELSELKKDVDAEAKR